MVANTIDPTFFMVQSTGKPEPTKEQSERLIAEVWNLVRTLD